MNGLPIAAALPATLSASSTERLATLFDAHNARLYRLARRMVPTADDALDLVQETFLRAARTSRSIPSGFAPEEAWLVRVLVNIQRDRVIPGGAPSHFGIDVQLNSAGAEKMRQATMSHLGKSVAILIDGNVVIAPTVKSAIGGAAVITGDYTQADAQRIAAGMTGATP